MISNSLILVVPSKVWLIRPSRVTSGSDDARRDSAKDERIFHDLSSAIRIVFAQPDGPKDGRRRSDRDLSGGAQMGFLAHQRFTAVIVAESDWLSQDAGRRGSYPKPVSA